MRSHFTPAPRSVFSMVRSARTGLLSCASSSLAAGRGHQVLRAGGRGVAVLHDQQHGVAAVQLVGGDAGEKAVVPEAAVAHDRQRAAGEHGRDAGAAREAHAVAEDGIAQRKRREGRERVAADIGRDVALADLALDQLDRGEHRTLGAADAEIRRPRRQRGAEQFGRARARRVRRLGPARPGRDVQVRGMRGEKAREPVHDHFGGVFARHRAVRPCHAAWSGYRHGAAWWRCPAR